MNSLRVYINPLKYKEKILTKLIEDSVGELRVRKFKSTNHKAKGIDEFNYNKRKDS